MARAKTDELTPAPPPAHEASDPALDPEEEARNEEQGSSYTSADLDAYVQSIDLPDDFDPDAVYVVMQSAVCLGYGEKALVREPAVYGDYIAAQPRNNVFGMARPKLTNPGDSGTVIQDESDGKDHLSRLWYLGHIKPLTDPLAIAARRQRIEAEKTIPGGRSKNTSGRVGDLRFAYERGNAPVNA